MNTMRTMMAVAALALAIGNLHAQVRLGNSVAQVENEFGKSYPMGSTKVDARAYIHDGFFVGVVYDSAGIAQAYYYFKLNGGAGFDEADTAKTDNCLPAGKLNWQPVPPDKMAPIPNTTVSGCWFTLSGNTLLVAIDCVVNSDGVLLSCRAYATLEGAKLAGQLGPEDWANGFSHAPKTQL
jgi:hypothetical protein